MSSGAPLGMLSEGPAAATHGRKGGGFLSGAFARLDDQFRRHAPSAETHPAPAASGPAAEPIPSSADFRSLIADFEDKKEHDREALRHVADEETQRAVADVMDRHIFDEG